MQEDILVGIRNSLRDSLHRRGRRHGNARFDTSDVIQEGLIQIWMNSGTATLQQVPDEPLVRTIASGQYCKLLRFHLARKRSIAAEESSFSRGPHTVIDRGDSPDRAAESAERMDRVLGRIEQMVPRMQEIFFRRLFFDESFPTIARELGITFHEVRSLLASVLKTVKADLEDS